MIDDCNLSILFTFHVFMFPLSNHYYRPIHKLLTIGNYRSMSPIP